MEKNTNLIWLKNGKIITERVPVSTLRRIGADELTRKGAKCFEYTNKMVCKILVEQPMLKSKYSCKYRSLRRLPPQRQQTFHVCI
jgi:hypothetical protein